DDVWPARKRKARIRFIARRPKIPIQCKFETGCLERAVSRTPFKALILSVPHTCGHTPVRLGLRAFAQGGAISPGAGRTFACRARTATPAIRSGHRLFDFQRLPSTGLLPLPEPFEPIVTHQLNRMRRSDGSVSAAKIVRRTQLFA